MRYYNRKRNTPVATLIRNYINKKSGKVSESRDEIERRFDFLDWKDQKKIILAFLDSGKTDRQWAYSKALDYWDKSFEPKIKELWEQLHEERCSWCVTRFFPVEYLSRNIDEFTGDRDYYFICLRLAKNKNFTIEKEKLSPTDYLAVLHHTGRNINEVEASDILFKIVHRVCIERFNRYEFHLDRFAKSNKGAVISPKSFQKVSLAIYYLKKLEKHLVVSSFEGWNDSVQKTIFNSKEYGIICNSDLDDFEYRTAAICIARKYAYLGLDNKYKKPSDPDIESILTPKEWFLETTPKKSAAGTDTLKKMIAENPAVEKLVEGFDLDAGDDSLPF